MSKLFKDTIVKKKNFYFYFNLLNCVDHLLTINLVKIFLLKKSIFNRLNRFKI